MLAASRGEGSRPSAVGALLDFLQNVLPSPAHPPHVDGETEAQTGEAAYQAMKPVSDQVRFEARPV